MSNKMWGGRFSERPDAIMEEINVSIDVDRHMYAQDIAASKAHAAMLAEQGIITASDAKNIGKGLDTILSEMGKGSFDFKRALEDIHMNVESRLSELIGPAAGRLHTARSRNDQVATDFKLYVRDTIDELDAALSAFQSTRWVSDAFREQHADVVKKHIDVFLANDVDCYRATCEMLGDADLRHYQASMRMPVSVIVGEEDYAAPVAMSEQIQKAVPGATLSVLSNVRHLTPIECPAVIAEKILELLAPTPDI